MCRLESISFDLEKWEGSTFILSDCLQSGVISILTAGATWKEVAKKMVQAIDFLQNQAGAPPIETVPDECRSDNIECIDVFSKVWLILKSIDKQT